MKYGLMLRIKNKAQQTDCDASNVKEEDKIK